MSEQSQFVTLLKLLKRDGDTIRIAYQKPDIAFSNSPVIFENVDAAVTLLTEQQLNVWFEINESNYVAAKGRSSEQNITRLSALYADLDFKDTGLGDLTATLDVIDDLSGHLGYQPSAIVYTGNGIHPYWPILDGEINDENRSEAATRLKRWGALVKATAKARGGDADSVYDLARILRVPGSTNFKGAPIEARAEFFESSSIDVAWIDEVLNDLGITVDTVEASYGTVSAAADWDWAEADCSHVEMFRREIETSTPSARHPWALKWAAMLYGMVRYGCVTEATFTSLLYGSFKERFEFLLTQGQQRAIGREEFNQVLAFGLTKAQGWSKLKLAEEMRNHDHANLIDEMAAVSQGVMLATSNVISITTKSAISQIGNLALAPTVDMLAASQERIALAAFTDTGNAENLQYALTGRFIFVPGIGWHSWDGGVWVIDQKLAVQELAKTKFVDMLNSAPDDAARKWAHSSLSQGKIKAALALAASLPMLLVDPADLDNSPFELNTKSGIVDLRTAEMRDPNPSVDFHTMRTGMVPARMPTPKWDAFLKWALEDDLVIAYIKRLFGAAAVGKLLYHHFPIFLGGGANGKTTLLDIISGCLGMYASQMPSRFLVESRGNEHPTEIAQLRGVRLAVSSEVPPSARFNEDLVKQLTGETRLRARYIGKDYFEFENIATHILVANHLPTVPVGGRGFWRRVRKVDFNNSMPIEKQNPHLVFDILSEEGPGVMQWIIDGAVDMLANGMQEPQGVLDATTEYQLEEDAMARFISEGLLQVDNMNISVDIVYDRYKTWALRQGLHPLIAQKFKREIHMLLPRTKLGTNAVFSNLTIVKSQWEEMMGRDDE
jgi:P4 family phage/plasmid primase-like protien